MHKTLKEVIAITGTNKTVINVEIDYNRKTISLMDNSFNHEPKKWLFSGRTIDYMSSWIKILDDMKEVIDYATDRLGKEIEKEDDKKIEEMKKVLQIGNNTYKY